MDSIYNQDSNLSEKQVSVHSAFICLLHLANEKNLALEASIHDTGTEADFMIQSLD